MRTGLLLVTDLARITGDALADSVAWIAVETAELRRRMGWFDG